MSRQEAHKQISLQTQKKISFNENLLSIKPKQSDYKLAFGARRAITFLSHKLPTKLTRLHMPTYC
jgi:hypothetical protein